MSNPLTLCILGSGSNVGAHVAKQFASKGYQVALVSRTKPEGALPKGQLHVKSDFTDPSSISSAFAEIRKTLGIPNVVVYNGERNLFLSVKATYGCADASVNSGSKYLE